MHDISPKRGGLRYVRILCLFIQWSFYQKQLLQKYGGDAISRATMMSKSIIYKAYASHRIKLVYFKALLYHILWVHFDFIYDTKVHRHENNVMIWDFQNIQYYIELVLICFDNFITADSLYFVPMLVNLDRQTKNVKTMIILRSRKN